MTYLLLFHFLLLGDLLPPIPARLIPLILILRLPKLESHRNDLVMDQVLVGQEFEDVAPTFKKLTEYFHSTKLLFVEYMVFSVN